MPDLVEESTEGLGSRLFGSIKGVATGLVLVIAAFPLLWVNEGCAVRIAKGLQEGKGQVVSVDATAPNPANEGKLVHLSGNATTATGAHDTQMGVALKDAVRLERLVEMYQWAEEVKEKKEKQVGGSEKTIKETTYVKKWSSSSIDASNFKLKEKDGEKIYNPPMPYKSESFVAADVKIGGFIANAGLVSQMTGSTKIQPDGALLAALPGDLRGRAKQSGEYVYVGQNPSSPAVGDMRIAFHKTAAGLVSAVAQQKGFALSPWTTSQNTTINMLSSGGKSAAEMFADAESGNAMRTWLCRLGGFLAMFIGFTLIFRPLRVVADVIPMIGSLVGAGATFVALSLAAPLSLVTIALAWVAYRPLIGVPLLIGALGIFVALFVMARKRKKK